MYSELYQGDHLKPLDEIKSISPDKAFSSTPIDDLNTVYDTLIDRYGHTPSCGAPYPTGYRGEMNKLALQHKELSCTNIPEDLKKFHFLLFDANGNLKSLKEIRNTTDTNTDSPVDTTSEISLLHYQVVARLGHPISCPSH
ncbi:hypothetical protein [Nocardia macrotermitis]|uniref:Uncharacterized protein n=1 Tax=Nocardia macrotermitis TaxID=2585198 RepID=A0A7K0CZV2_9NOCA|nr:hypothetical protein [Nocardia macrotermitis]MQY18194.1 hypothetical protein [Nocardia macrotermitis]